MVYSGMRVIMRVIGTFRKIPPLYPIVLLGSVVILRINNINNPYGLATFQVFVHRRIDKKYARHGEERNLQTFKPLRHLL